MVLAKIKDRAKAIQLRKRGYSYNEIKMIIPVSKSSLSVWLRNVKLDRKASASLIEKSDTSRIKACQAVIAKRIRITSKIIADAEREIGKINKRELWLIGTALYWAEGAKQKEHNISQLVQIGNSDPRVIKLILKWLTECCKIPVEELQFRLAIHETANVNKAQKYWSNLIGVPQKEFKKTLIKKHKIKTNRKVNDTYRGLLEIRVRKSTNFNRKIFGWIQGINKNIGRSSSGRTPPFGGGYEGSNPSLPAKK